MSRETATRAAMAGSRLYRGPMASVKQIQVTFDCAEPERVARFWCEVLGYVVPPPPEGFATWDDFDRALPPEHQGSAFACIDPSGVGPRLFFQRVPEGKVVKNRLHLDVRVGTGLVGEERLAALEAEMRTTGRARHGTRATTACRWRRRVVPRDAGHRGQRVLSRLSWDPPADAV
jgi:Glyoxalase-like domain